MNENRIMQQISAIFSVFMVFFYVGVGCFLIFYFENSYVDKALRVIMGSTFIFYGIFRTFKAYVQIKKLFFTREEDND
ncbi:MAG TPA: hypothetical protein VMV47_18400 [Bacteroidales bacterium]|nr:hypothetical protein [Bacteroidales bacterium]